jgi:hypothetical protein
MSWICVCFYYFKLMIKIVFQRINRRSGPNIWGRIHTISTVIPHGCLAIRQGWNKKIEPKW